MGSGYENTPYFQYSRVSITKRDFFLPIFNNYEHFMDLSSLFTKEGCEVTN